MCVCIIYTVGSVLCFNESSVFVNEDHGLVMLMPTLTYPSSTDIMVTVITTDGTTTGEVKVDNLQYIIVLKFNFHFMVCTYTYDNAAYVRICMYIHTSTYIRMAVKYTYMLERIFKPGMHQY